MNYKRRTTLLNVFLPIIFLLSGFLGAYFLTLIFDTTYVDEIHLLLLSLAFTPIFHFLILVLLFIIRGSHATDLQGKRLALSSSVFLEMIGYDIISFFAYYDDNFDEYRTECNTLFVENSKLSTKQILKMKRHYILPWLRYTTLLELKNLFINRQGVITEIMMHTGLLEEPYLGKCITNLLVLELELSARQEREVDFTQIPFNDANQLRLKCEELYSSLLFLHVLHIKQMHDMYGLLHGFYTRSDPLNQIETSHQYTREERRTTVQTTYLVDSEEDHLRRQTFVDPFSSFDLGNF
ncbi:hypothetical protein PCE1_000161 [Barthelona sp. PCE]